jgi:hypothetical protein
MRIAETKNRTEMRMKHPTIQYPGIVIPGERSEVKGPGMCGFLALKGSHAFQFFCTIAGCPSTWVPFTSRERFCFVVVRLREHNALTLAGDDNFWGLENCAPPRAKSFAEPTVAIGTTLAVPGRMP